MRLTVETFPKVKSVKPLEGKRLLVTFHNDEKKIYDCTPLLTEDVFEALRNDSFFKTVKPDHGGYGISWSDEVDLSESELWLNGTPVEQGAGAHGS